MPPRLLPFTVTLCALLGLAGCKGDHKPKPQGSSPAPSASSAPTPPPRKNSKVVDVAEALRFLDTWVKAQNSGDFERYASLYAEHFSGTKRVEESTTVYGRADWLADRKPMFERGATVAVTQVQTFVRDLTVELLFEQRWSSSTFADVGTKSLVLTKQTDGYLITREAMVSSRLDQKALQGPCTKAYAAIAAFSKGVRYFAYLESAESAEPRGAIVEVSSQEDANRRAKDEFAWEVWGATKEGPWLAASAFRTSPSGDWLRYTDLCFRADGSLAEVTDSHRTFYSEHGLVNDTVTIAFAPDGKVVAQSHDAVLMESGKPAPAGSYMRPPPEPVMHSKDLPFKL